MFHQPRALQAGWYVAYAHAAARDDFDITIGTIPQMGATMCTPPRAVLLGVVPWSINGIIVDVSPQLRSFVEAFSNYA